MKLFPSWSTAPSESTIEQLANHILLLLLHPRPAWFFVPTKREETHLGYDASLIGTKGCVLQYKRVWPLKGSDGVAATIKPAQLSCLHTEFPKQAHPFAFIGLAEFRTYKDLANHVAAAGIVGAGAHCCVVNIHDLPFGTTSLRINRPHPGARPIAQPYALRKPFGAPASCLTVLELAQQLICCTAGVPARQLAEVISIDRDIGAVGRVSVLFVRPMI